MSNCSVHCKYSISKQVVYYLITEVISAPLIQKVVSDNVIVLRKIFFSELSFLLLSRYKN